MTASSTSAPTAAPWSTSTTPGTSTFASRATHSSAQLRKSTPRIARSSTSTWTKHLNQNRPSARLQTQRRKPCCDKVSNRRWRLFHRMFNSNTSILSSIIMTYFPETSQTSGEPRSWSTRSDFTTTVRPTSSNSASQSNIDRYLLII